MNGEMMTALAIRPGEQYVEFIDVPNDIDAWREWIGEPCRTIDIPSRFIEGMEYDFVVDDEGLINTDNPVPCAADEDGKPMLFGNTLVFKSVMGEEGRECAPLNEEDLELLSRHIAHAIWGEGKIITTLLGVSYYPDDDE